MSDTPGDVKEGEVTYFFWQAKRRILATVFAFACVGLLLSFLLPQKWTSQAIVTPAESVQ
ncbi:Wzz/FepE/Etk N-terminal domain-containing protein, partial [Salmonella enterica subsp. enterica serovar Lubbock]|nr:Wzz/FepE/Etk N-terminal domain-containing protein [Salmonella enterica subsp. enterica serovar Lubbock]